MCWYASSRWWEDAMVHYCRRDGTCCSGSDDAQRLLAAQRSATAAVLATILRVKPTRVAQNKWNKAVPGIDFFMVGMAPHGLLLKLCETGMAALRAEYAASSATAAVARAKSPHPELVELSFHEVSGARLDRLFHLLRDSKTGLTCKLVASLLEPGRALSIFFQNSAEGQLRHGRAAMCDMAFAPTSGLIAALQYWSSFARGECRTVRMLWQHAGHPSIVDWFRDRPQEPIIKLAPAHPSRTIVSSSICL